MVESLSRRVEAVTAAKDEAHPVKPFGLRNECPCVKADEQMLHSIVFIGCPTTETTTNKPYPPVYLGMSHFTEE